MLRGQKMIAFALFAETQLARLTMERGENQTAADALTQIIDEANRIGQPFFAVDASVHLADALTRSGEPERALEVIDVAKDLAGEDAALYEVPLERLRAGALVAMGRPDEALGHVEPALASAREQRLVYEEALLLMSQGRDRAGQRRGLRGGEPPPRRPRSFSALRPPLAIADVVDDVDLDEVPDGTGGENPRPTARLDQTRGVAGGQINAGFGAERGKSPPTRGSFRHQGMTRSPAPTWSS